MPRKAAANMIHDTKYTTKHIDKKANRQKSKYTKKANNILLIKVNTGRPSR